ncbi:MAG: hypothetical protein KC546_15925 [Anaerolineae bacterium]|nr:hypothetical protein [Anaerolineae bacterium]MCA9893647.1 hypothetical protein [Anaerolineae bacterium]
MSTSRSADQIDRLLDAVEHIQAGHQELARPLLQQLIREDSNFEDAWLWMSVAVDDVDQTIVCLDNVLRINPKNDRAALALSRLQAEDMVDEAERARLRGRRDLYLFIFWLVSGLILLGIFLWFMAGMRLLG